jgi:hypothetical protein
MRHSAILAITVGLATCLAFAVAQETPRLPSAPTTKGTTQPAHHTLSLKLYEKRGEAQKTIANPTILTNDKQPFSIFAGGEILDVSPSLEYGTSVKGTIEMTGDGALQLALRISIGTPITQTDPNIAAVKSQSIDVRMNIMRSVTKTIQIDADTWVDVRVD